MTTWYITEQGYHRGWHQTSGRLRYEHDVIWEEKHGLIPEGHIVHHIDGDKLHNEIENLKLVTHLEHRRIHSGCILLDGLWWKPCSTCGATKLVDGNFYERTDAIASECKSCSKNRAIRDKRIRSVKRDIARLIIAQVVAPLGILPVFKPRTTIIIGNARDRQIFSKCGHPYAIENIYHRGDAKICRVCKLARQRRWRGKGK